MIDHKRQLDFSANNETEIAIAPNAGACFGVVRAIKLGSKAVEDKNRENGNNIYSFGPLIHNPRVVRELEQKGLKTVNEADDVDCGTVIIRSHGVQKEIEKQFRKRNLQIIDATCLLVKKPQRIAQTLGRDNYFLVVVGDANHPEVKGVLSYFGNTNFLVTYQPDDIDCISSQVRKVGVIAQTTIEAGVFNEIVDRLKKRFGDVVVFNTICDATATRQNEAARLAKQSDVMIVVGGKNSSNTNKLVKICQQFQPVTHHVEELTDIDWGWFKGKKKIGVTGGASTPMEYVDWIGCEIANHLSSSRQAAKDLA